MSSLTIGLISAGTIFAGSVLGIGCSASCLATIWARRQQDVVKLSAGTIATLAALVLGLLVSCAKSSFETMNTGIVQGSAKIILLDRTLARYGPESRRSRRSTRRWARERCSGSCSNGRRSGLAMCEPGGVAVRP